MTVPGVSLRFSRHSSGWFCSWSIGRDSRCVFTLVSRSLIAANKSRFCRSWFACSHGDDSVQTEILSFGFSEDAYWGQLLPTYFSEDARELRWSVVRNLRRWWLLATDQQSYASKWYAFRGWIFRSNISLASARGCVVHSCTFQQSIVAIVPDLPQFSARFRFSTLSFFACMYSSFSCHWCLCDR